MLRVKNFGRQPFWICLPILCLCAGFAGIVGAQTPAPSPAQRRQLPKPPTGSRGFEKYSAQDTSARQIAGGATRAGFNPRHPVAPLEGRAYDARPYFVWELAFGAKSYHFVIYEGDVEKNPTAQIVFEADMTATEWPYPAGAPRLKPGTLYSWRVSTPSKQGKDDGNVARFVILDGAEAAEVKQALASAGLLTPKTAVDRLDQARIFANYGIWYDALHIAKELAENPNNSEALTFYTDLLQKLEEGEP